MRIVAFLCATLLATSLYAESTFPKGCHPVTVQGESVTLQAKIKLVYIHNLSNSDLWVTHPVTDAGASAGWASRLQANNWSALAVNKTPFILNCIESRPGHEQQIPCEGAIAVCQWPKVKIPSSTEEGAFWAGEDKSLDALNAELGSRGILLQGTKKS